MSDVETGTTDNKPRDAAVRAYATDGEYTTYWDLYEYPEHVEVEYLRGNGERIEVDDQRERLLGTADAELPAIVAELTGQGEQAVEHARAYWDLDAEHGHGPASRRRVLPDSWGWQAMAQELTERGGVPERMAECVALVKSNRSYREAAAVLEIPFQNVGKQVERYRERLDQARWLANHGPEV